MNKHRNYFIDILKFISALLIVLYHSKNLVMDQSESIFIGSVIFVDFFFLTSGYYFARSAVKTYELYGGNLGTDTAHFMWHKICGFMPNYVIAWMIALAVKYFYNVAYNESDITDLFHLIYELMFLEQSGIMEPYYVANNVTWYLSAMILTMFIMYPLVKKYRDVLFCVIAPITAIFLFGVLYRDFMNLKDPNTWVFGFIMKGMIRAIAEISLGCVIYRISEGLKGVRFTGFVRFLFSLFALFLYGAVAVYTYDHPASKADIDIVFIFAAVLLLMTSSLTWFSYIDLKGIFGKFVSWLSELSFSLFLGHGFWSQAFNNMFDWNTLPYETKLQYYLGLSFGTGLFIMYLSRLIRFIWSKSKAHIIPLVIKKDLQ